MKKSELVNKIAEQTGVTPGEAADQVDQVVHRILTKVRKGQRTTLPGLGQFLQGTKGQVTFERTPVSQPADQDFKKQTGKLSKRSN